MNKIIKLLYELGISEKNSLKINHQGVRDNENIKVLKCKKSGVFVLDDILQMCSKFFNGILPATLRPGMLTPVPTTSLYTHHDVLL